MALTEYEVDPSIAGNSGTGTHGDPYGDLQYALDTVTRDSTNGDRFNIWNTSDEVQSATLNVTSYGTPTRAAPLHFQGMTSTGTPGDGGVGGISGGGSSPIMYQTSLDHVHFRDLHLHNVGNNWIARLDAYCSFINVEANNTSSYGLWANLGAVFSGCYVHDVGAYGITVTSNYHRIQHNILENDGTNEMTRGISCGTACLVYRNALNLDGATIGIYLEAHTSAIQNSIYANAGTGAGIYGPGGNTGLAVVNNVVEGFSGTGGTGFEFVSTEQIELWGGNAAYNNTVNYTLPTTNLIQNDLGDNETLSASPFTDPGNNDFRPVDTGSVKEGSVPQDFYV